ncbi:hypothetical protein [Amycolatopsis sp. GM8]|uniref:hypothetical protein n=1 Tax=Amycolatopsis sp. GM8 TaxID=2896530 RepID=UPI001F2C6369|nr:hypothetical protein [Amycolatopsis sp. GM8]
MSGHLDEAAGVFNAAAEQVPVELAQGADQQLTTVVQYIQQAGGPIGEELTGLTQAIQQDLQGFLGRLVDLRNRLGEATQRVLQGGS